MNQQTTHKGTSYFTGEEGGGNCTDCSYYFVLFDATAFLERNGIHTERWD
jgi:hypothetical protein